MMFPWKDQKVRLGKWDGSSLKDVVVLEGNKGIVSALAFSPDGNLLASGDVIMYPQFLIISFSLMISSRAVKSFCWMSKRRKYAPLLTVH